MKKKVFFICLAIFILSIVSISTAFANSYDNVTKTVTIDTDWTDSKLETVVKQQCSRVTDIVILNITAGMLTDEDIIWISKNLSSLEILSIRGATTFEDNNIPDYAFSSYVKYNRLTGVLDNLKDITIDLDDGNPLIFGDYLFYNCKLLTDINLPNVKKFGVYAFYECSGLERIRESLVPVS